MNDKDTEKPAADANQRPASPYDGSHNDTSSALPSGQGSDQVDPRLLELLVCPLTKTRLQFDAQRNELISKAAGLAFPIKNGVPLMIEDAARTLDD